MAEGRELIVGIDAGLANISLCVFYRDAPGTPICWKVERICEAPRTHDTAFRGTMQYIEKYRELLDSAVCIVLESQMRDLFLIVNTVIRSHYPVKTRRVSPFTLCGYYKLPRKRLAKKTATIRYVKGRMDLPFPACNKLDDLADSALLAFYAHDVLLPPAQGFIAAPLQKQGE